MNKGWLLAALLSFSASQAIADDLYGGVSLGIGKASPKISGTSGKLKSSTPIVGEISLGTYLTPYVRGEASLSMYEGSSKVSSQDITVKQSGMGGMLNLYYDFTPANQFIPYVVGGIGYTSNKFKLSGSGVTSSGATKRQGSFNYQLGLGIDYTASMFRVGLGYRFRSLGSTSSGSSSTYKDQNGNALKVKPGYMNMLVLGARFDF